MALLASSSTSTTFLKPQIEPSRSPILTFSCPNLRYRTENPSLSINCRQIGVKSAVTSREICTNEIIHLDRSVLNIQEAVAEDELWAAACLRVRTFFSSQQQPYNVQDHMRYLAEREFEALKERVAGKRVGFKRVSCLNATIPLSRISDSSEELCSLCKYSDSGEDRIVIGTLDLNQCLSLPDEITGKRPEGTGPDLSRAYLSNVCVAKELHKNGIGSTLVAISKKIAQQWGMTDLYVHVAVDNEAARQLYIKSGFVYENDEPAWQARFLDRPRRILLWTDVSGNTDL
ncbi:hypothetical protein ACHQM5_030289 [Ranunculus cassubicifolius]